eukprot:14531333-Ditylum_brightwellii.AAC.1
MNPSHQSFNQEGQQQPSPPLSGSGTVSSDGSSGDDAEEHPAVEQLQTQQRDEGSISEEKQNE